MIRGISVNVGINFIDKNVYNTEARLQACENDARDMERLAKSQGFETQLILSERATYEKIKNCFLEASENLSSGDCFLFTIACHGSQIPSLDGNEDEIDGLDETWLLFDRQLIDDELYELLGFFKPGVRILVISDSCHSGTILKAFQQLANSKEAKKIFLEFTQFDKSKLRVLKDFDNLDKINDQDLRDIDIKPRAVEPSISIGEYEKNKNFYITRQQRLRNTGVSSNSVKASVLLLSGCQDNQLAADGERNGFFTEKLLKVWNSGRFDGNYIQFYKELRYNMPPWQTPNYYKVGVDDFNFENQKPFTLYSVKGEDFKMTETINESRFIETVAVAVGTTIASKIAEEVADRLTREGMVRRRGITSVSRERSLDDLIEKTIDSVIDRLTREGMVRRRGITSVSRERSLDDLIEKTVEKAVEVTSRGEPVFENGGSFLSPRMTGESYRGRWDKILDKVVDKVIDEVAEAVF